MKNQSNIFFLRITLILLGVITCIGFLHLDSGSKYNLISGVKLEQEELAEELAKKYDASVIQYKFDQKKLIDKIIPLNKIVVADSVVKDFYQKGKDVFVIIKINNSSKDIYAKLKCSYSAINEYFKLKSNKVFAVFEADKILFSQPFYETEMLHGEPLILSCEKEILISGTCLHIFDSPTHFL